MTINEIKLAISKGEFSLDDLNTLTNYIQSVKVKQAKRSLKVGDDVFVVQKTKRTYGVIRDIKIKKAIVSMRGRQYNVPLSMIEPA